MAFVQIPSSVRSTLSAWFDFSAIPLDEDGTAPVYDLGGSGLRLTMVAGGSGVYPRYRSGIGPNRVGGFYFDSAADGYFKATTDGATAAPISTFFGSTAGTAIIVCQPTVVTANSASANLNHVVWGGLGATDDVPCIIFKNVGGTAPTVYCVGKAAAGAQTYVGGYASAVPQPWIIVYRKDASNVVANKFEAYNQASGSVATLAGTAAQMVIGRGSTVGGLWGMFDGYAFEAMFFTSYVGNSPLAELLAGLCAKYLSPNLSNMRNCYPGARGDAFEQVRDAASRRGYAFIRPSMGATLTVPYRKFGHLTIGDRVSVIHPGGYDPAGAGGGWTASTPRTMEVVESVPDLDTQSLDLTLRDSDGSSSASELRYKETAVVTDIASAQRQGSIVLSAAAERRQYRASQGCFKDPATGLYTTLEGSAGGCGEWGIYAGSGRSNLLLRSSFISGSTGLTLAAGSGTCALDTTASIFDTTIQPTPQCVKITAGATPTTGGSILWPQTEDLVDYTHWYFSSPGVGPYIWLVVAWEELGVTTEGLTYRLYRSKDAKYWDAGTSQFSSAAAVYNTIANGAGAGAGVQFAVIRIKNDTAVYTVNRLQLMLKLANGGTASRAVRVYHAELRGRTAGSVLPMQSMVPYYCMGASDALVPTDAAAVEVRPEHTMIRDATNGVTSATNGTIYFRAGHHFLADVLHTSVAAAAGGRTYMLALNYYGSAGAYGPSFLLEWDTSGSGANGTLTLTYRNGASAYTITYATDSTWFTAEQAIAITWSGTTVSLYVGGALVGSTTVDAALPILKTLTFGTHPSSIFGGDLGASQGDCYVRDVGTPTRCWTAEEVYAWATS